MNTRISYPPYIFDVEYDVDRTEVLIISIVDTQGTNGEYDLSGPEQRQIAEMVHEYHFYQREIDREDERGEEQFEQSRGN